jgi:pimeloyl-ACP methyl ester carboxylesterase
MTASNTTAPTQYVTAGDNTYACEHLPNAQLIIYPDSGHGALFQHAGTFTSHVSELLDRDDALVV